MTRLVCVGSCGPCEVGSFSFTHTRIMLGHITCTRSATLNCSTALSHLTSHHFTILSCGLKYPGGQPILWATISYVLLGMMLLALALGMRQQVY